MTTDSAGYRTASAFTRLPGEGMGKYDDARDDLARRSRVTTLRDDLARRYPRDDPRDTSTSLNLQLLQATTR